MKQLKGVIFDLDGVIVNTVPLHFKAWHRMFTEYGIKFTFKEYKAKVDGIPRLAGARAILTDISKEELNKAAARKQDWFLKFLRVEAIKVYKSTIDLIKSLKKNDIKVAVISSSKNCLHILRKVKVDKLFNVILTGNDIKKGMGKPNPFVFLLAAKKLKLKPKECIVVEDAVLGIEAAKRARMKSVGIDRYKKPRRLKKADIVVSDLRNVSVSKLKGII